ncbi:MAG: tRNA pseudouridine(38-40) synthase TruA [Candidatus Omnitrophica bacterium]|nr:tRNA pseudouridine(38-40) synthase TruA [Candidatus Omnitrophota bacterium]
MRNIKLTIEYDGTSYKGWQIQQKRPEEIGTEKTIQGVIERVISGILQEEIRLIGAGRTDAGVHALGQVGNFKTKSKMPMAVMQRALNALLPKDIIIVDIEEAKPDFNSRFNARLKTYRYQILNRDYSTAFDRLYQNHVPYKLDAKLMAREARVLVGRRDFKSFQAADKKVRNSIRNIRRISVRKDGPIINIDLEANGFLYNMVRNIVGTLIEIGRGKLPPGSMKKILRVKDRTEAGPTAPAKGLCLLRVRY